MEKYIFAISFYTTMLLGVSVLLYFSSYLLWKTTDKILGLMKFSKILIQYARNKGKCYQCRKNDVYSPTINKK